MKILSVDQARNGAWSIFDFEKKELLRYGTFEYRSYKYTFAQAVLNIERLINSLIQEHQIDVVFIEGIQLRCNVKSYCALAQLQGVLINLFEKNQYSYFVVPPVAWQNYCKAKKEKNRQAIEAAQGKKNSKMLSINFVKEKFDISTTNDNLADAICIGWYVCNNYQMQGDVLSVKAGKN